MNNNDISLKDYDYKPTKGDVFTAKSTSPIDFNVNKSPINKIARSDSHLANKKKNEAVVTFLKALYW